MSKTSKIFGLLALCGALLLFVGVIMAIALFDRGEYSFASGFVTELGQYRDGYLSVSSALYFNAGMVIFGLTFGLLNLWRGSRGDTSLHAAAGFTGALAGVLAAAQGIFTLNFPQYHYAVVAAFYFSAFAFCVVQVVSWLKEDRERFGFALLILTFAAGALCLASGIFTALGGFEGVLNEVIEGAGRLLVVPFALIGWLAVAAAWASDILLSVGVLASPAVIPAAQQSGSSVKTVKSVRPAKSRNDFML